MSKQTTVRTTIRIREDLLKQSRLLALHCNTSLQEVINDTLAQGFGHVSDLNIHREALARIDKFRESLKGKRINIKKILRESKKDLK